MTKILRNTFKQCMPLGKIMKIHMDDYNKETDKKSARQTKKYRKTIPDIEADTRNMESETRKLDELIHKFKVE